MFIVFTKGEIIMNNIYKVIWSKAKNCYVVASEIARSHTKSATGSGKIGGVTRRSLLASLMALSLLCGGLGVAEASVRVNEVGGGTSEVYTTDETYTKTEADANYAKATAVASNKTDIDNLKTAVGNAGSGLTKEVSDQKAAIAVNKDNITKLENNKLNIDAANSTFATKDALNDLTATVNNKVDESEVETALQGKADKATTLAGYGINDAYTKDKVDEKLDLKANAADVYTKTDADGKFATSDALTTAKTDLEEKITTAKTELDGKIAGNTTKITANEKVIQNLNAKAGTTETTLTDLSGRMAAAESDIDGLQADMATAKSDITSLKAKDTELSGKIDAEIKNRITSDTALDQKIDKEIQDRKDAIGTIAENKNYIEKDKSVSDNLVKLDAQATKNADAITANNKRTAGIKRNDATNETTIEGNVTVDNLGNVKAKGDVTADGKLTGKGVDAGAGDITTTGAVNTGSLNVENASQLKGDVTMDKTLSVTGDTKLKKTDVDGTLSVNKETTLNGTLTAKGEAKFEKNVTIEKDLTVNGKLNVGEIAMENKKTDADGTIHNSSTTITADGITHHGEVKKSGVTTESQFTHTEKGSETYAKKGDTTDWTETRSDVTADGVKTEAKDSKGNRTNTSQTAKDINSNVTDKDGNKTDMKVTATENSIQIQDKDGKNTNLQVNTKDSSVTEITNAAGATTKTEQTAKDITNIAEQGTIKNDAMNIENNASGNIKNTAQNGTITNDAKDIVNNASGDMTNTVGGKLTTTVTGQATENFNGGLDTNVTGTENHTVTGDQNIHITGKQTNKIDGDQENTIGGNQTTTVTGDVSNKAKNITNEASNSITDKVGDHTRVLDSDGITDTVGGSTFKQRIDKIMMESKDVSIKAEETLTNEAKVITNKASEVINNEAVNINNTATGIITSKASEIKNQADKLISNKVGENTWENMENGKITTSIKDGSKQNLTQSDAAGTTQSTVDGNKSTVTIQNADGLTDAVRDGAGNENGSVATATTSANTIKSGSKANTVISTADGTSFINSEAAAPVTGESGVGTAKNTTIKGNTITSGKVTMDYAEVMKDLGVRGNANITGKTTTGSLEVTGTSTLKGDVTMGSNATVKKDLTVEGNTNLKNTKVDGTLDVTQKATFGDSVSIAKDLSVDGNATIKGDVTAKSYKVGDKTYISAAGINANDQKITNVADGSISEGSKDAVNGGQLYTVKNDLEGKVNKVGANAAAMANLHPMEFDPDSKWNIAAAIGNYGSETAAALGAFYRPNNDVMVNLSTAFGTGENMVGGGVSVRLGKGSNKLSREENNALKAQVDDLTARMDALLSVLNLNMSKDFPDVPENHWAYEAVSRLAGNDIVQGYPDGEFHGERTMTRYEMAEIIYNALSRGAEAEKELVEEFKPELQAMAASEKATAERAEG